MNTQEDYVSGTRSLECGRPDVKTCCLLKNIKNLGRSMQEGLLKEDTRDIMQRVPLWSCILHVFPCGKVHLLVCFMQLSTDTWSGQFMENRALFPTVGRFVWVFLCHPKRKKGNERGRGMMEGWGEGERERFYKSLLQ